MNKYSVSAVKRNGEWVRWTYAQYMADVRTAAKAFISVGVLFLKHHFFPLGIFMYIMWLTSIKKKKKICL